MSTQLTDYGIVGQKAPEFGVPTWVDKDGNDIDPIKLADLEGKFKVLYCFQSWCPGCHSRGLPALKKMVEALEDNDQVEFLAIQTVFEGKDVNTKEKMLETQAEYGIPIPFAQDEGDETTRNVSSIMYNYRTGGTPWFIFIDQDDNVVFNEFHLDADKAIEYLKSVE